MLQNHKKQHCCQYHVHFLPFQILNSVFVFHITICVDFFKVLSYLNS